MFKKIILALLMAMMLMTSQTGFSASDIAQPQQEKEENLITTWMQLALLGKNQAEIEFYFIRNDKRGKLEEIKEKMRSTVMDNLKRTGVRRLISQASDEDDLRVVKQKIVTEIRYMGMEHDEELKSSIKEEFGIEVDRI